MSSMREIAQNSLDVAREGIGWIALWKEGRSWQAENFWPNYDPTTEDFKIDEEDLDRLNEIANEDPTAVFVNSYYHNLGGMEELTREDLTDGLRFQYNQQTCNLAAILDSIGKRSARRPRHEVYGYVNGETVYTRDEFIFKSRGRGPIESDEELLEFARKKSSNWQNAGWCHKFEDFYLSDYALSEPYRSLTLTEFARLKQLQEEAVAAREAAEAARCWEKVDTIHWADNSVEEIWKDKNGATKTVTVVGPHGDVC